MDTQGPAIRTGDLTTDLQLKPDDIVEFTVRGARSEETYSVDVNYDGLVNDISAGDTVLVDNGVIQMLVLEKRQNRIRCRVLTPGTLGSRRHINLPGVRVNLPPLTQKDLDDIRLGVEVNVDFVALSLGRANERSDSSGSPPSSAVPRSSSRRSRINRPSAKSTISGSDVIMVARAISGIECPMADCRSSSGIS
jgi:pyruvate kinase